MNVITFSVKNTGMQDARGGHHADLHFSGDVDNIMRNICSQNKKGKSRSREWCAETTIHSTTGLLILFATTQGRKIMSTQ